MLKKNPLKSTKTPNPLKNPKEIDFNKILNTRIQIFSLAIVAFFMIILIRLFYLQVSSQESYQTKLENFTQTYQSMAAPRGEIYDRHGEIMVTNTERLAIVYFPPLNMSSKAEWDLAYKMADDFEFDYSTLTLRDLQDLYLILYPEKGKDKITDEEWNQYSSGKLSDNDIYLLKLSRISEIDLSPIDDRTKEAYVVHTSMVAAPYQSLKIVKDNVTTSEVAYLIEHNSQYPGFDVSIFFDRSYPQGTLLRGLLGSVTNSKQGLASENLLYYLALGYSRNSSIGRSGLEMEYESLLKGTNSLYTVDFNDDGLALFKEAQLGSKGQDLTLSIDLGLQRYVETLLGETLQSNATNPYRSYMDTIYLVAINPKTGDVLSLAGMKENEDGTVYNDPVSAYTDSFAAGSSIKGAVVYMGLTEDLIKPGEVIFDTPVKIADTPLKRSWKDLGNVNDLTALSMSSNVYMFHIAMRLGGANYTYNGNLNIDADAFDTIRSYFSQFGLGTMTGIDVPNETLGYRGFSTLGGHLLDFAIGQYDTYTTIQLAQYISTIANDGVRVQPRLLLESKLPGSSITSYQNTVNVLSTLDDSEALKRVQAGFRLCVTDGLCSGLNGLSETVAAKTGTAENYMSDEQGNYFDAPNSVVVSYAPYENPEIAIACAVPHAWNTRSQSNICVSLSHDVYQYYFENR